MVKKLEKLHYEEETELMEANKLKEETELMGSTTEALGGLGEDVKAYENKVDREKFEKLLKEPGLKWGLEKLFEGCCQDVFGKEWKKFENMDISNNMNEILEQYPDLWLKISGELGLPIGETKFSNLTVQQKINYYALYQAVYSKSIFNKKTPKSEDIVKRIDSQSSELGNKILNSFKIKNISNFLLLEKTLKEDYKLTEYECAKVKEYLLLIKKHPEYLGNERIMIEAGIGISKKWWFLIGFIVGGILTGFGVHWIDKLGTPEPQTTIEVNVPEVIHVENPEAVLKLIVTKAEFGNDPENPISERREVTMFTPHEDDGYLKSIAKEWINSKQRRELVMKISGEVMAGFNLEEGCSIDIEKNYPSKGKGVAYIQLPEPDLMILNDNYEITKEKLERIHLDDFKNLQEELRQDLRDKVLSGLKNNEEFIEMVHKDAADKLLKLLQSVNAEGVEIENIKIRFFDPKKGEHPITVDPHQPFQINPEVPLRNPTNQTHDFSTIQKSGDTTSYSQFKVEGDRLVAE